MNIINESITAAYLNIISAPQFKGLVELNSRGSKLIDEARIYAVTEDDKRIVCNSDVWGLFELRYEYCGGYKSYESIEDLVNKAKCIYFVYDGELDRIADFDIEKCILIATLNLKAGLKITSVVTNHVYFHDQKFKMSSAFESFTAEFLQKAWCEVSGKAEKAMIERSNAMDYLIDPNVVKLVYPDLTICEDGIHYVRALSDGTLVQKIAFGTIRPPYYMAHP